MTGPDDALLRWAVAVAAPGSAVDDVTGLRDGGSPWLLNLAGTGGVEVVLRMGGEASRDSHVTEVAALELAGRHSLPAPELLAADLAGEVSPGVLAVLTSRVPGTSRMSAEPSPGRLRALGAAAAAVHTHAVMSSLALPVRTRPIGGVDFAMLRRAAPARPLLIEAEEAHAIMPLPERPSVLVHGDLWHGNTLWDGATLTGLIDWDCAGVGQPGIDLGSLRCDAALCSGAAAADEVLAGYEAATDRRADDVAYWDLVAGLATPPTMDWFVEAIHGQGRTDLDQPTLLARRDAFLRSALDRLG